MGKSEKLIQQRFEINAEIHLKKKSVKVTDDAVNEFFYKFMFTLHQKQKQKTRRSPGTKIYKGCMGLIK